MHDYVKNLAKVVRAAREEDHLSQAALAEQLGCDEQEAAEILSAIEYLLALIHKGGNSNE